MIIGREFTYISNPKTGSTSVYLALSEAGFGEVAGPRHIPPHQIYWNTPRHFVVNVRHPEDRLISAWAYLDRGRTGFSDWLRGGPAWFGGVDIKRTSQAYWAKPEVQSILRFETLADDWATLLEQMNLPFIALPHHQKSERPDVMLTSEDKAIIRDRFAYDFEQWGYDAA